MTINDTVRRLLREQQVHFLLACWVVFILLSGRALDLVVRRIVGDERGVAGDGLDQFFRRGQDFDHRATILGRQSVAAVQIGAAFEENSGLATGGQGDLEAAALAFVIGEGDGVGGIFGGFAGEDDQAGINPSRTPLIRGGDYSCFP